MPCRSRRAGARSGAQAQAQPLKAQGQGQRRGQPGQRSLCSCSPSYVSATPLNKLLLLVHRDPNKSCPPARSVRPSRSASIRSAAEPSPAACSQEAGSHISRIRESAAEENGRRRRNLHPSSCSLPRCAHGYTHTPASPSSSRRFVCLFVFSGSHPS